VAEVAILYIGDIIGSPGRDAVKMVLPRIAPRLKPDVVVANGENAAAGFGITPGVFEELLSLGIDVVTSGNHIWDRKEIIDYIGSADTLLRPANYPLETPGKGHTVFQCASGVKVGVVNLCGRAFMDSFDCPFRAGERIVEEIRKSTPVVLIDMHAETTSEKCAFGWRFDGSVSAVIGSHTHVQTSDERILPRSTAYITDAGMTGPTDSVIGIEKELAIKRFLTGMPVRFEVAKEGLEFQGVFVRVDASTGRAISIERIKEPAIRP
jgi:metallophosphoesterase (TIGR00282 family)